jgi:uncharacterized alpha-E superfamily protein
MSLIMLSRTASNLYWIGRYVERAEFTARLLEATIRLDSLSARPAGMGAWTSALAVASATQGFKATGENISPMHVSRYLALDENNPSSIRSCIQSARSNARAARVALTREAWETINRAWNNLKGRTSTGGTQATLNLADQIKAEARGFEGAINRMLHSESYWFVKLGSIIERGESTARLLDVKYHLLLPEGEKVGGLIDRDQWLTLLQVVSARTAYHMLYPEGLKPWLVAEMLIFRRAMPRSLVATADEAGQMLSAIAGAIGKQGQADRLARRREAALERLTIDTVFQNGLHQFLVSFIRENSELDAAIAEQFRFT